VTSAAPRAHRITVTESPAAIRVEVDGVIVAESNQARVLQEGSLPPRYYLPPEHVRTELLAATDTSTTCPFNGRASYWSLELEGRRHGDIVWCYETPIPEMTDIAGMMCFFNERVELYVDDERQERPTSV
jgi:uncharacterized protein (DUF427 family)